MRTFKLILFIAIAACFSAVAQKQYSNLPTFYINTEKNEPIVEKEKWINGTLTVVSSDPSEALDNAKTEIRGRGNSTWGMPKKPYRLKLDKKTNLLNLPAKEKNWVLLQNYADKTLMRNALAFKISEIVGLEFTPSVRFVDVVLNNEFLGSYLVTDQIEVKDFRVPVETQEITDTEEPAVSGGYLLEIDGFAYAEPVYITTDKGLKITVKYPKDDEINSAQLNYITRYIKDFEGRLFSDDFTHETNGYRAMVDTTTLINWYIGCELSGNSDSFWSTYIYKYRENNKLYFGPMWDYDIAFNNDSRLDDATRKLMRDYAHHPRLWIERFCQDEWFLKAVDRRWKELEKQGISEQLTDYITETAALLDESQKLNFARWPILSKKVYLETYLFNTYKEGVDYLKEYVGKRVAFLSEQFSNPPQPSEPFVADDYYYSFMNKENLNFIDVRDNSSPLVLWAPEVDNDGQDWRILPLDSKDMFRIVNKRSGLAMASARKGQGGQLIQKPVNDSDQTQKWRIIPVKTGNIYGILNVSTAFVIDNNNHQTNNGNPIIEWSNNMNSQENQQWFIIKNEPVSTGTETVVPAASPIDITYDKRSETAFVSITANRGMDASILLYNMSGNLLYRNIFTGLPAGENTLQVSLNKMNLKPGIYMIHVRTSENGNITKKLVIGE